MKQMLLLALAASLVSAQPHHAHHRHSHMVKRVPDQVVEEAPSETVVVYELNGKSISEAEVEQGIRNGSLIWAGEGPAAASSTYQISSAAPAAPSSSHVDTPSSAAYVPAQTSKAPVVSAAAPSVAATTAAAAPTAAASSGSSDSVNVASYGSSSGTGVDSSFPDGQLDCSTFPSSYGAVAVNYLGLGGWTGIQQPAVSNSLGYNDILTVTHSTCSGGNCCTEGSFCSYACPAGYQKSQWPSTQGATGQSVGGIQCKGGKLRLTNSALSSKLCVTGTSKVTVKVINKLKTNAAICRTDYPGTESETIPLDTAAGSSSPLTCPDANSYYTWQGKGTSAQYYVNNQGVSVSDACQWGDGSKPVGNFAPLNLGVGYSAGSAWLSIFQNSPTTNAKLDFTIELGGDNVIGKCKYSNGQYCSGDNYDSCNSQGCTVSAASGQVTYTFY